MVSVEEPVLTQLLPRFIEHLKEKGRSPSTILAYRADIEQLTAYLNQNNKSLASQVVHTDLESFRDYLLAQKYTAKSVSRKLNAIKTFFRWVMDGGFIEHDPSKNVGHPKIEVTPPKYLSKLEYRALRDVIKSDPRIVAIVELILQLGLRISEVAKLELQDLKDNMVIIRPYATQHQRAILINRPAKEALDIYMKIRPKTEYPHVFVSKNGKPMAVRNIRAAVDRYMQKAEVPEYSVNDLRTTFIVENLRLGVDLATVSQAAGHKRLSTTERYLQLAGLKDSGKKQELEEL